MVVLYPTFICKDGKDYLVYVPDLDSNTEGKSMEDAVIMARDLIGNEILERERLGLEVAKPSNYENALKIAKSDTDIIDFSKGFFTMVDVDMDEFRRKYDNRTVRRNVTIPSWMDYEAKKQKINVSGILQEALAKVLKPTK